MAAFFSLAGFAMAFDYYGREYRMMEPMGMREFPHYYGFEWFVLAAIVILLLFWICSRRDWGERASKATNSDATDRGAVWFRLIQAISSGTPCLRLLATKREN